MVYYVTLFLCGLLLFKNMTIYLLVLETVPDKARILVSSWILSSEAMVCFIPTSLSLLFGVKNIWYVVAAGPVFGTLSVILTLFIPESPKYLFEKRMFPELRKTMGSIAKFNRVKMGHYTIEGEVSKNNSGISNGKC